MASCIRQYSTVHPHAPGPAAPPERHAVQRLCSTRQAVHTYAVAAGGTEHRVHAAAAAATVTYWAAVSACLCGAPKCSPWLHLHSLGCCGLTAWDRDSQLLSTCVGLRGWYCKETAFAAADDTALPAKLCAGLHCWCVCALQGNCLRWWLTAWHCLPSCVLVCVLGCVRAAS